MTEKIPETLITTYLEQNHHSEFESTLLDDNGEFQINAMTIADVAFYRFLYSEVGKDWHWRDRLFLSDDQLREILVATKTTVDVLYVDGVPAGYVELDNEAQNIEVAYFGLRPMFFGRGLGKYLLSYGVAKAWNMGAKRVWVHTCNLDGPQALNNYLKRGFRVYKTTEVPMPERYKS